VKKPLTSPATDNAPPEPELEAPPPQTKAKHRRSRPTLSPNYNMATTDIIYHNVGGSMNVVTELLKSSLKLKPKIISLAECPLENGDWMEINGYTCYADTMAQKYGCAVYIKNEYVNMFSVESITGSYIRLWTAGTEITFGYQRPHQRTLDPDDNWHRNSNNLIIGDLNAKHNDWSAGKATRRESGWKNGSGKET
jgi:hypothetical protein